MNIAGPFTAGGTGQRHAKARQPERYSWLGNSDLLIVKADQRDPLAVLPLALVVELMLAAERGTKAKE